MGLLLVIVPLIMCPSLPLLYESKLKVARWGGERREGVRGSTHSQPQSATHNKVSECCFISL